MLKITTGLRIEHPYHGRVTVAAGRVGASMNMDRVLSGSEQEIKEIVTRAMEETADSMKQEARAQVRNAGMSQRLANTWRSDVYPQNGKSLNPAAYLYSLAPDIIDSFSSGQTIRGRFGLGWLMIPTGNIPVGLKRKSRSSKRTGAARSLPLMVEDYYGQDLIFIREKDGQLGAYVNALAGRRAGTFRPVTAGRRRQGRESQVIKMFSVVRSVARPAVLNLERIAQVGQQAFPRHLQDNWR